VRGGVASGRSPTSSSGRQRLGEAEVEVHGPRASPGGRDDLDEALQRGVRVLGGVDVGEVEPSPDGAPVQLRPAARVVWFAQVPRSSWAGPR
jgi:hypothetical protein